MKVPRSKPYIWVTWITGLLAGTDRCAWKAWTKSHYQYTKKTEVDPQAQARLDEWNKKHDAMTAARTEKLRAQGHTVRVERENKFVLDGKSATLSGQPDIIVVRSLERAVHVIDEKSGKQKEQYVWQVLLYMLALSVTSFKDWMISGEIEYTDVSINVPPRQLSLANKDRMFRTIQMIGANEEPARVPSEAECEYCDILDCPDRFKKVIVKSVDVSEYF